MIVATLSGLQDYLFAVPTKEGGQAKALRARSRRLLGISITIEQKLQALGAKPVMRGGAKFVVDADGFDIAKQDQAQSILRRHRQSLLDDHHGGLRLSFGCDFGQGGDFDRFLRAQQAMLRDKLRPWQDADSLVLGHFGPDERKDERKKDAQQDEDAGADPESGAVPVDARGHPLDFGEIAANSAGMPMLGVLAADADNLGAAFINMRQENGVGDWNGQTRSAVALNDTGVFPGLKL